MSVCPSVSAYVRMYVRPSIKSFFNLNEIWHVDRGRWVMHEGIQYDPIQGQGHEPFKVGNLAIFKSYSAPFTVGAGNWPWILKLGHIISIWYGWILVFPSFCVTWLWTWQKRQLRRVDCQFCTLYPASLLMSSFWALILSSTWIWNLWIRVGFTRLTISLVIYCSDGVYWKILHTYVHIFIKCQKS